MRFSLVLCLATFPALANADTIEAPSRVVSVTLYPYGASVVRRVEFEAPAGVHDLIVPDLPPNSPASALRVAAPDGVTVGAVNLATGRFPVTDDTPSPEVQAAEDEVERLEAALRQRDAEIVEIRLRVDAANEQWTFLRNLGQGKAAEALSAWNAEDLRDFTRLIGEETLAARQAAHAAEQDAQAAELAREDDVEALDKARQALAALVNENAGKAVLTMAVEAATDGTVSLDITTFAQNAGWRPVYDMRLTRGDRPELTLDRGVLVSQASGEDWSDVALTLSTARPSERSEPSRVVPWLRRIDRERDEREAGRQFGDYAESLTTLAAPEPVAEAAIVADRAQVDYQGTTVVYRYGTPVDVRDGVEDLRLRLDTMTLEPEVTAIAVPRRDPTAFLVADVTNGDEVLLPGDAQLYLDGAFVGQTQLPLIAAGADTEIGFGAIDGLRLTRTVPNRTGGERGLLSSRNELDEVAILKVENLTSEDWPVRVLDQVPYSEQDDLEIIYSASPQPTETDVEDMRGVLAWEFDLAAGDTQEIRLEHSLRWPDGYILR